MGICRMKTSTIIAICVVIVIVTVVLASGVVLYMLSSQKQGTITPTPQPTFSPTQQPTFSPTPQPTSTPTPSPSPTPVPAQNIAITYSMATKESIVWVSSSNYSYIREPDSGKIFLEVNMTIKNNGYDELNTNPNYFYVIVDQVKYNYDGVIYSLNCWDTVDVLDGGTYTGTLLFQIPESASSSSVGYERSFKTYDIVWTKI